MKNAAQTLRGANTLQTTLFRMESYIVGQMGEKATGSQMERVAQIKAKPHVRRTNFRKGCGLTIIQYPGLR